MNCFTPSGYNSFSYMCICVGFYVWIYSTLKVSIREGDLCDPLFVAALFEPFEVPSSPPQGGGEDHNGSLLSVRVDRVVSSEDVRMFFLRTRVASRRGVPYLDRNLPYVILF